MSNLAVVQKDITDAVNAKVSQMQNEGLVVAPNYAPANALKSAFFAMTNSPSGNLLEKCSKESIANALLDMVVQGLSPAKTQCYFIPYGNTLKMTRSYFGTMKVVKQLSNVKDIWAEVVFEGDVLKIRNDNGRKVLESHETDWTNQDNAIIGAYCIIEKVDGERILTVMTKKEIDRSWQQSKNKSVQNAFPQEMAKRTVINRAAKQFFNTSDDSDILIEAVNRTTENEFDNNHQIKEAEPVQSAGQDILDKMTGKTAAEESAEDATISEVETVEEAGADISKMETTEQIIDAETGEILDEEEPF
ncbi:recombinase RecT [Streptococcus suis]|nr:MULTISPECIES: RecT family recombinase [Streptococcus]MCB2952612.1 recombinase RecT [Streptococcus suis]MCK3860646.1 recombinase RecT [Streptococcus suis]MCK4036748.1 recombinase RecT [Streptococcus suis]NQI98040.1 recombinase RecT [Streptococcus suis]NQJ00166.1 recombinase RecT [Streptococcus suis]